MRTGTIYGLCGPGSELRYVGKTVGVPRRRRARHRRDAARTGGTHLRNWLKSLAARSAGPALWVLEADVPEADLGGRERAWIAACRSWSVQLTNATDGGDGLNQPDKAAREKMSIAKMGRPLSAKHRAALSAAKTGKKLSKAYRIAISNGRTTELARRTGRMGAKARWGN